MDEQIEFLKWIAARLDATHIPYMLTGSMAVAVYATPRMTRDVDLVVELGVNDVDSVVSSFSDECYIEPEVVRDAVRLHGMFNIIHNTLIFKADFIVRKHEPYRLREFERRKQIEIEGSPIWIVSAEDLVLSKLVWARQSESEIQLRDVGVLIENVRSLDWAYMREWAEVLNVEELLQRVEADD